MDTTPLSFQDFLTNESMQVDVWSFVFNLVLTAVLSFILSRIYIKYGNSLSNRKIFSKNFMLLGMTTMLIISIVKSSLALSLGLVGALSIVRFRAAIKEPEELAYLFLCIALGLGFGADQRVVTIAAFVIIATVIVIKNFANKYDDYTNLHLTISCTDSEKPGLENVTELLQKYCSAVNLRRFDETENSFEVSYLVEFTDFSKLSESKQSLQALNKSLHITFMDNKGIQ